MTRQSQVISILREAGFTKSYIVNLLLNKEVRETISAAREARKYLEWKVRQVLEESGADKELASKPFSEFPEPWLAKLVGDIMEDEGYAEWVQGRLRWLRPSGPPPAVETECFAEYKRYISRVLETLPEALLKGTRPLAHIAAREEAEELHQKLTANIAQEWMCRVAITWAGLNRLPPDTVVVDISDARGFFATILLRYTGCRVIFVDPFTSNLEEAEKLAEIYGVGDRLETRSGRPEELQKVVPSADLAVAFWALHQVVDPVVVLRSMRNTAPAALLCQPLQDEKLFRAMQIAEYLLGYGVYPTYSQLKEWFNVAGWRVITQVKSPFSYFCILEAA